MPKNLVIVESPAKAKTISRFLGTDYEVMSSFGHIRDLPKKGIGVDIEGGFKPAYEVSPDKKKVVSDLKKAAKGSTVWLASDEDREGEAIAWHTAELLGLDPASTKRIVFHEITKPAISAAIEKPRVIDMKLVDAQQTRRILDRLVGYELSPVLWKKVRTGLSAGRVQSVAVRLIVEREREIRDFRAESTYKVTAVFDIDGKQLEAELPDRLPDAEAAKEFLNDLLTADFEVASVEQKPGTRNPGAPFTTSTLQQEAARRLGYSVRQTMNLAQRLYESGHITYMRTDSTNLSGIAINAAKEFIDKEYGDNYSKVRQYKTKSQSAQEAHEAIRPTNFTKLAAGADAQQKKLYDLIWRRALASQMAPATVQKTEITISINNRSETFGASGEVVVFDGFLKVYGGGKEDKILPEVNQGQKLKLDSATALETFSRPQPRYSEASLVRKLEALGIGRPSTYAPTISVIQDRGYIEKADLEGNDREITEMTLVGGKIDEHKNTVKFGADRGKLLPTELAEIVTDFLIKYFGDIIDYDFTARAEEEFDDIADGKRKWQEALRDFYSRFHPLVEKSAEASRAEASQARELGKDPKTNLPVVVRFGRYGPVLQLGDSEDENQKLRFAPLPSGVRMEDVTLEQALPMFELPRTVGKTADGEEIIADIGRFGPYIKVGKTFVSIKGKDPHTINEEEARQLFAEKEKKERERVIADFGEIKVLRGPYGPYVTNGKKNARIPKDVEAEKLSEEKAKDMLDKAPDKPRFRRRVKKA
ncbi:MAG TPA: type I DNA topoisomerase [Candidatus Saccharimonadales bacterium]|nr:type I DNA topoisomerase [Candidatus Saccharimonadales bacterium]